MFGKVLNTPLFSKSKAIKPNKLTNNRVNWPAGCQPPIATKMSVRKTRALTYEKYVSQQGINVPK